MNKKTIIRLLLAGASMAIFGCGGGGGSSTPAPAAGTTISGAAVKGPVNGADVTVFAVNSDGTVDRTANLGTGKTAADGTYTITLSSSPTGPVVVEVTGNAGSTYADEVSTAAPVQYKATLRTIIPAVTSGASTTVAVTPLTEMAFKQAETKSGGLIVANINDANKGIATFFGVGNIATSLPSATATADQQKYAAALAVISQLVTDQKGGTEALADALPRVMTELGKESASGGFSADTIAALSNAVTTFKANNPSAITPTITKPTAGVLHLSTSGTISAGTLIGGIDVTVALPAGVSLKTLTGSPLEPDTGVVTISGEAAKAGGTTISAAKITPASGATPATIKFIIGNSSASAATASGFGLGEFVTIKCDVATTATFPAAAAFKIQALSVLDGTNTATTLSTVQGATAFNAVF